MAIFGYFTAKATEMAGLKGVLSQYVRPVGSAGAGILGDIFNSSKIIAIGFVVMIIGLIGSVPIANNSAPEQKSLTCGNFADAV